VMWFVLDGVLISTVVKKLFLTFFVNVSIRQINNYLIAALLISRSLAVFNSTNFFWIINLILFVSPRQPKCPYYTVCNCNCTWRQKSRSGLDTNDNFYWWRPKMGGSDISYVYM